MLRRFQSGPNGVWHVLDILPADSLAATIIASRLQFVLAETSLVKTRSWQIPIRAACIRAAGERKDREAIELLKSRLRQGAWAPGQPIEVADQVLILEAVANCGGLDARTFLESFLTGHPQELSDGAARALGILGDRRAAPALRKVATFECDPRHYLFSQFITQSIGLLGDSTDLQLLRDIAQRCYSARADAIEAVGYTCGLDVMASLIDEVIGPDAELAVVRSYQMLGAKVRDRLAERAAAKGAPMH